MPRRHAKNAARQRPGSLGAALFCTLLLLPLSSTANAHDKPPTGVRPELQNLLRDVETQLREATARDDQEDIDRLIDLQAQLQVIELQVELEGLQRTNTALQEQTSKAGSSGLDADTLPPGMSGMQGEVEALNDMQANTVEQLDKIAEQHAFLLEQLGQGLPGMAVTGTPSDAPAPTDAQVSARLREVRALNEKFKTLAEQQSQIEEVLAVVSEDHANLLTALGVAEPAQVGGSYTVKKGDSLSSIAEAVYGAGDRWPEIVRANPSLSDPSILYVGAILTIP